MNSKSRHRDTQRSGRKKDSLDESSSDLAIKGQLPSPLPPESPTSRDHERCRHELAEAKLLATNLEKTLRWWAECASKWKERWARANAERHRAKKEARSLKQQVVDLSQEVQELREELKRLKNHGTNGEEEVLVREMSGPGEDTTLEALEAEVREVLKKLKTWKASSEAEGEAVEAVETTLDVSEAES